MSSDQLSPDEANSADGEGVWSSDVEQAFQEGMLIYPPCGRRKHILQEEGGGKMYGRNELIARHIFMRTGKVRTRKQVSSHIQVLARRKAKQDVSSLGCSSSATPSPSSGSSGHGPASTNGINLASLNAHPTSLVMTPKGHDDIANNHSVTTSGSFYDIWMDRPIVTQKIRLVEFSAFIEHRNPSFNHLPANMNGHLGSSAILPGGANHQRNSMTLPGARRPSVAGTDDSTLQSPQPMSPYPVGHNPYQVNPLASNHHLTSQFNYASNDIRHQPPNGHHMHQNGPSGLNHLQGPGFSSPHLNRHSYVQIDYRQPTGRQTNKLERIDISQIQDKFPGIGGPDGLFQRCSPEAFFLVKFWADINNDYEYSMDDQNSYFAFSSQFETVDPYRDITCSTKACSYGFQVVEKVDKIYGTFNSSNGRYSYDLKKSPMCEFMIQFIKKLRQLPRVSQMNSVLENFTILQVITNESTPEVLLCLAYVFEVASIDQIGNGPQYHVYKLTKD